VTSCAPGQEQVAAATQQQTGGDAIQPVEGTAVPEPTQQPVEPTSVPIPKGIKEKALNWFQGATRIARRE
jgi:hypothetical protein